MKAASREAQAHVEGQLDELIRNSDNAVAVAAQVGTELFLIVDQLDASRSLRVAVADPSLEAAQREGIITDVFGPKVAEPTKQILVDAAAQEWSTPREFRAGLVALGRRALMRGADEQGQLEQVEDELYELSVLLEKEKELVQLLSDHNATAAQKRGLLASVIYGKVSMFTERPRLPGSGAHRRWWSPSGRLQRRCSGPAWTGRRSPRTPSGSGLCRCRPRSYRSCGHQ